MTAYESYLYRTTTYDHVPVDIDFPSEEHRRITCHGGRGVICAYYRKGPLSRICWGGETILGVYCNQTWKVVL